jgi:argininosuccinate lyase
LFDTVDTVSDTLRIVADMVKGIEARPAAMRAALLQGHATATDLADYLVKHGVPFRDAHGVVAEIVRHAESRNCDLADLSLAELQKFSPKIGADVSGVLSIEGSLAARSHFGGTAPETVRAAVKQARADLARGGRGENR